jgi:hypothetical protein
MALLQQDITDLLNCEFKPADAVSARKLDMGISRVPARITVKDHLRSSLISCRSITQFTWNDEMLDECCAASAVERSRAPCNKSDICDPSNWQSQVAFNLRLLHSSSTFTDAIKSYLAECVTTPLANIVHKLESLSAWHSYFSDGVSAECLGKLVR